MSMVRRIRLGERALALGTAIGLVLLGLGGAAAGRETSAKDLLKLAGADVGFCVHLGCGREKTADLTADLAADSRMLVHGLALDDASLERARKAIEAKDLSGRAMVEKVPVNPLPYLRDLANLVVIEDFDVLAAGGLTRAEVDRIVAPGGVVCIQKGSRWTRTVKVHPREMDDWTHPFHGADGNRVSSDRFVQFPVGLRWQDGVPMNFNLRLGGRGVQGALGPVGHQDRRGGGRGLRRRLGEALVVAAVGRSAGAGVGRRGGRCASAGGPGQGADPRGRRPQDRQGAVARAAGQARAGA
jgi:hypothetical protein